MEDSLLIMDCILYFAVQSEMLTIYATFFNNPKNVACTIYYQFKCFPMFYQLVL